MGRVFSWEEIVEGKVPTLENFTEVIQRLRRELSSNDGVIAALIFGSALWDDLSTRSDVDCFVIMQKRALPDLMRLVAFAKELFVPLEIIWIDIRMAKIGIHPSELDFLQHLKLAAKEGGTIKKNPILFLKIPEDNRKRALKKAFKIISTKLNRALCELSRFEGEKWIFNLGKILEAPLQIVRVIVWAKRIPISDNSKREVLRTYNSMADERSKNLLEKILKLDREYSELLEKILKYQDKEIYKEAYKAILDEIKEVGQNEISEFIVHNAQLINQTN